MKTTFVVRVFEDSAEIKRFEKVVADEACYLSNGDTLLLGDFFVFIISRKLFNSDVNRMFIEADIDRSEREYVGYIDEELKKSGLKLCQ